MTKKKLELENKMYRKALEEILNVENDNIVLKHTERYGNQSLYAVCYGCVISIAEMALEKQI